MTAVFSVIAIVPMILGQYVLKTLTVNTTKKVASWLFAIVDIYLVQAIISILINSLYLSHSGATTIVVGIIVHAVIGISSVLLARYTWVIGVRCHESVLNFHDYLINYKSTPRSKILRRHLPSMDAVVEELSAFEQSHASFI